MRISELLSEGGWETTSTQSTVITPEVVKSVLSVIKDHFIPDFNQYLDSLGIPPIEIGHPTGSSAYYLNDPPDTEYGDIDLQIIVPPVEGKNTTGEQQSYWGSLIAKFIQSTPGLSYVSLTPKKKPIFKLSDKDLVQVDIMPHTENLSVWGRFRATSERGIKGLLNGNIFSVLSKMFDINLQHSGIQYKTVDGKKVNYTDTRNGYDLKTVGTNIHDFVKDIFKDQINDIRPNNVVVDPLLKKYPGVQKVDDVDELRIQHLVNAVKGLARSFEASGMYGHGDLESYKDSNDFLKKFLELYMKKAKYAIDNKKFDKAATPNAILRAQRDKQNIANGAEYVKYLFSTDQDAVRYLDWLKQK